MTGLRPVATGFRPLALALAMSVAQSLGATADGQSPTDFPIHSLTRPQPPIVDPGPLPGMRQPPADAVVLFDGSSLTGWRSADASGQPARWKVAHGYMEVTAGTGNIATARGFGDVQLHIEWMAPLP